MRRRKKLVVRVALLNDIQEMLLVRQRTRKLWQFPGGIIGSNEKPSLAAKREVREETGLRVARIKLIHTETILRGSIEETVFFYTGIISKTKKMVPDGKEIDKLIWTGVQDASTLPLTDTTKLLMTNMAIISLFV